MNETGDRSSEQGLGQYYESMAGNVQRLSDARVIGMGEYHKGDNNDSARNISQLLKHFAKPEDILFIEGWPKWLRVPRFVVHKYHVPKGVKIYGWDDIKENDRALKITHEHPNYLLRFIKDTVKMLRASPKELGAQRQITDERKAEQARRDEVVYKVTVTDRNKTLLGVVDMGRKKSPDARVFFIAGREHINQHLADGFSSMHAPYALVNARSSLNLHR